MPYSIRVLPLLPAARRALHVGQEGLASALGTSLRTVQRWSGGGSYPTIANVHTLARLVYPKDPKLAAQLAATAGTTVEALGLVVRPAPPPQPVPPSIPAPPPPRLPAAEAVIDSVVCAAAETMGVMPAVVRPSLLAAFRRAGEIGLSVEAVTKALETQLAPAPSKRSRATVDS